jgi:hypothetical protein
MTTINPSPALTANGRAAERPGVLAVRRRLLTTLRAERTRRRVNLALQGGGAHGAFTWGVLDRLLEEPDLEIVGIAGASAGAVNAAVLASGLAQGGVRARSPRSGAGSRPRRAGAP